LQKAKLLHFYPGLNPWNYNDLGVDERSELWEAMTIIQAQAMLNDGKIAMWPHLKPESYKEQHKDLYALAHPQVFQKKKKAMTAQELQAYLAQGK
jgi:hypothetical protein